jgi:hypothetical protein
MAGPLWIDQLTMKGLTASSWGLFMITKLGSQGMGVVGHGKSGADFEGRCISQIKLWLTNDC